MPAAYLEFLLEEPSMEAFLQEWLPRQFPALGFACHAFQGKQALLRKLESRLRGYRRWLPDHHRLVVIVDQDNDDCKALKRRLEAMCQSAGLSTRSTQGSWQVATCIAIEELEAWYFGDWQAVQAAYPQAAPNVPRQARFRNPDQIRGGTWEAFQTVMNQRGYFPGGLRKMQAAQAIGAHIDPARTTSPSFRHLAQALSDATQ